jgi:hypothetical protein
MTKARYTYVFSLTGQDEIDFITCRSKFKVIEVIRRGIKECLKECPIIPQELIESTKKMINEKISVDIK